MPRLAPRRLALALALALPACVPEPEDEVLGGVDVGGGVVVDLVGGPDQGYLATNGLFTFTGHVSAVDPSGELRWSVLLPGGVGDLMRAPDGTLYVATDGRVVALDATGRDTGFDGAGSGRLAWHPWGLPMRFGQDGVTVFDHDGDPALTGFSDHTVHAIATDEAGDLYLLITDGTDDEPTVTLHKTTARFEPLWYALIDTPQSSPEADIATVDDLIVISYGESTEARDLDGAPLWRFSNIAGDVLIDDAHTAYISGHREAAITRDAEVLWENSRGARLTLTSSGLGAMLYTEGSFGSAIPTLALLDRATGEITASTTWEPLTDFIPPAVIGDRLVGAGHLITTSQSFPTGGGVVVSQAATLFVDAGPAASPSTAAWPTPGGPGGARAAPFVATQPTEADLVGLWLARDGTRSRVIALAPEAFAFGLIDEPAYGLWDYDSRERPRLVQVGRWAYDGETLTLSPTHDLTAGAARTALRVSPSPPGGLRVDDPLQDVTRTFARAGRLPTASGGGDDRPPRLDAIYGEDGPSDANTLRLVAAIPGSDDAWVVLAYSYQGKLGDKGYLGSNIRNVNGQVSGNLFNEVVARMTPDGEVLHAFHSDTPDGPFIRAIVPEGADGVRLYGPFTVGETTPVWVHSALARPSDDALTLVETVPWLAPDDDGRELEVDALGTLPAATGGVVYAGHRVAATAAGTTLPVVTRVAPDGAVAWQTVLAGDGGPVTFFAVGADADAVYVLGTFEGALDGPGGVTHPGLGVDRSFLARLDAATGALTALRPLGQGGLAEAHLVPTKAGGFVLGGRPLGRFSTGAATLARDERGGGYLVAAFDPDLATLWTRTLTSPGDGSAIIRDLAVDDDGYVLLVGTNRGTLVADGVTLGGSGRVIPLIELSPCGDVLRPRYLYADVRLEAVDVDATGRARLAGGYMSDLIEPPFVVPYVGKTPTPSSPTGGTNALLMTWSRPGRGEADWAPFCAPPAPSTPTLTVTVDGLGAGRVTSDPPGIDCPGTCSAAFDNLTEVRLIPAAADRSSFAGFSRGPFAAASCDGVRPCSLLMVEDTDVRAHFEASWLRWVAPVAIDAVRAIAARDGRVAVAASDDVYVLDGGDVVTHLELTGSGGLWSLAIADDGATAIGVSGAHARLYAEGGSDDRSGVIVLDADGDVRWARALHSPTTWPEAQVAWADGDLVVSWVSAGTVTLDEVSVSAPAAALGRFDGQTGDLVALVGLTERTSGVGVDPASGRVWIRGGAELGGAAEPLPGLVMPDTHGPWFVVFEPDLSAPDGWRWADWTPPIPAANLVDSGSNRADIHYLDGAPWPRWRVVLSGVGDPRQRAAQAAGRLVLGDVDVPASGLSVWDAEGARLTLHVVGPGARPGASWVTPVWDEVEVLAVAASGATAFAAVKAKALRDAGGAVAWQASGDEGETAVIAVELEEVAR